MERITRDVPKWSIYQHREARGLKMVDKDDSPERQLEDEVFDRFYAGNVDATIPTDKQGPLGQWATRLHGIADTLPSVARLMSDCRDDADASATAVEILMQELAPHMLRYDTCYPNTEDDARRMGCDLHNVRQVVLRRRSVVVRPPERARWQSFGWTVKDVQIVKD